MSESILYLIFWDSYSPDTYLYGSSVKYMPDRSVRFSNRMMPSGHAINLWTSYCSFQGDRHEPQLPILEEQAEYVYRAYFKEYPKGTVLLRFDFYNQQSEKIHSFITEKKAGEFTVPKDTFWYTMQLVQGGSTELTFYHVEIFSRADEIFRTIQNRRKNSKKLNIIIPEAANRMLIVPDLFNDYGFSDVIALSPGIWRMSEQKRKQLLEYLVNGYVQSYIFGKGREAQERARDLSKMIKNSHVRKWLFGDE